MESTTLLGLQAGWWDSCVVDWLEGTVESVDGLLDAGGGLGSVGSGVMCLVFWNEKKGGS